MQFHLKFQGTFPVHNVHFPDGMGPFCFISTTLIYYCKSVAPTEYGSIKYQGKKAEACTFFMWESIFSMCMVGNPILLLYVGPYTSELSADICHNTMVKI